MRSNHYSLAASLSRIGITNNPRCKCDMYDENLNHVLFQCALYDDQRGKLIQNLKKMNLYPPYNIESVIAKPNIPACNLIFKFLSACNLRI